MSSVVLAGPGEELTVTLESPNPAVVFVPDAFNPALAFAFESGNPPPGLLSAGAWDDFSTGAGQLPGRLLAGTGIAWALERATNTSATHDTSMTVTTTGDGTAGGNAVAAAANSYSVVTAPSQNCIVVRKMPGQFNSTGFICDHITATPSTVTDISRLAFTATEVVSGGISTGRMTVRSEAPGAALATVKQISDWRAESGDVESHEYTSDGELLTMRRNGRACDDPLDVSVATRGVPLSRKHGINGQSPTTMLDYFAVIVPATDAAIVLEQCPYVASVHPDGTATICIAGRYSMRDPVVLKYTLYDRSSGFRVAVSGHTAADVTITSTAIDSSDWGTFTGEITLTEAQASALAGDPLELKAWRTDVKDQDDEETTFEAWTQRFYLGTVILVTGQSLGTHLAGGQTVTTVATPQTGSTWVNASSVVNIEDRRALSMSADTTIAHISARLGTLTGLPCAVIGGGLSATSSAIRVPDTAIHTADRDGVTHAGGRVDFALHVGGQNDVARVSDYYDEVVLIAAGFDSFNRGADPLFTESTLAASWTSGDANYHSLRETQARLVENGIAAHLGPNVLDLRHQDDLHLGTSTTDPYGSNAKFGQRVAQVIAFLRGDAEHDGQGPELSVVERTNATTITAYFADDSYFDSFAIVGTSGAGFHGGCRFSASTDASSPIWPTGCSVGARIDDVGMPKDQLWPVTFTFGSTLPSTVYVWAGYGANPHNPTQDATINSTNWDNASTGASILQATLTGAPAGLDIVGIRPRLRYAAPSYLVAS